MTARTLAQHATAWVVVVGFVLVLGWLGGVVGT